MGNLVVDESALQEQATKTKRYLQSVDEMIDRYMDNLLFIRKNIVKSGDTAEALDEFSEQVKTLKGTLRKLGGEVSVIVDNYLCEIREADRYTF